MPIKRTISRVRMKRLLQSREPISHPPTVDVSKNRGLFKNVKILTGSPGPTVELSKKRKHKPHKPHHQYQRALARAILDRTPNWHELSDDDLVSLVTPQLPGPGDKRKTVLRAAGRLK